MKNMSFTNQHIGKSLSFLGRLLSLMVLLWGVGINVGQAQTTVTVNMPSDSSLTRQTITDCSDATTVYQFKDDDSGDGALYSDSDTKGAASTAGPRQDTVEFCPQDRWHIVTATFTEFDVANLDGIRIFDGSRDSLQNLANNANAGVFIGGGTGTVFRGSSVSNMNGGWVAANCSPDINPTGCLTFIFSTTNDNIKGLGWDAWVTCADRGIRLSGNAAGTQPYSVESKILRCDTSDALPPAMAPFFPFTSQNKRGVTDIAVNRPVVLTDCGTASNSINLTLVVKNQSGTECLRTTSNINQTLSNLPAGIYTAEWFVTSDPTKTTGEQPFSVSLPALVCNDNVEIPLGSACSFTINVDDILENPCDTSVFEFLSYHISIEIGEGKDAIRVGSGTDVASAEPVITKDLLQQYLAATGEDLTCGGEAKVTIERLYRTPADPINNACSNQNLSATCSTIVSFSDKTNPTASLSFVENADTLVVCDTSGLRALLRPGGLDNCMIADTIVTIRLEESDPCFNSAGSIDTTRAFITVTAVDMCGNTGSFNDTVVMIRPPLLSTHVAEARNGAFECDTSNVVTERPGLKTGFIKNGDFNVTDTVMLSDEDYTCGYILVADSEDLPSTDCGRKELITWSVVDWCAPDVGPSVIDTQLVEFVDTKPPLFLDTLTARVSILDNDEKVLAPTDIPLGAFECTFDANTLDAPDATDNCDDTPTVTLNAIYRIEDGAKWLLQQSEWAALDCDSFCVRWVADDDCHEQTVSDVVFQTIVVRDVTAPLPICVDEVNVSVPSDAGVRVGVEELVTSATDPCGVDSTQVRIKDSGDAWSDHVIITCDDVHEEVEVEVRAIDKQGNVGTCWLTVVAEDKIPPICEPLENDTITCRDIHTGELGMDTDTDGDGQMEDSEWLPLTGTLLDTYNERFGNPVCSDNLSCGDLTIQQEYQLIEGDCGALRARRRVIASDWQPMSSTPEEQLIIVEYVPEWTLTFPADVDLTCADNAIPAAATAEDIITNGSCDLWALEVSEKTFQVPGEVCLKIERTYHLVNDCAATDTVVIVANNPLGATITEEGNETTGRIEYTQVIKLYVTEAPVVTIADVNTCIVGVGDAVPFGEEDDSPGVAPYECDTLRTFSASATNCIGADLQSNFEWRFYVNGVQVDAGTGSSFTRVVSPKTIYTVEFWASDGCGNSAGTSRDFEFWDCKKPTPYLLNGVAIELGETGTVDVWAKDLDQGSFDNCTDQDDLELFIGLGEPNAGATTLDEVRALDSKITVDCDNVGTQSVSIYVVDEEGNWAVTGTFVLVQDNMNVCNGSDPTGMVAGRIVNPNGLNVEQVTVSVAGAAQTSMTTTASGDFQFELQNGGDYTITPVKDINPLNGVSTFDLVLISKHILGITPFDSPYEYIAADVNKSGSITAFDMVQLRQLILNITNEFPNNDSWRFVDSKYEFTSDNPADENFGEFMDINNLSTDMMDVDFVGVKIGDINGNAAANSLVQAESRTTSGALTLNVADRFLEIGETVSVDFTAADIASTQGYQFTLNFAGLELTNLGEGAAKVANFNANLADRGLLATSWNGDATADEVLFTLKFKATQAGLLSEFVSVSSDITPAEAYKATGELLDVNLDFSTPELAVNFGLDQNNPNPFKTETVIGFTLPKAGTATLTIMDIQGRELTRIEGEYAKGYNTVTINAKELGATGVLHYQLESADNVATRKMIIIE